ncbi:MAG TPA: hypothetical protein ENN53_01760 [Candidatus Acetothermia bacterium]|nr:hypothetical protein [Candidatus Acetothermia bacterium]
MYFALEGLPALGKSELLSVLRLYYPREVIVFPELVKEVAERGRIDLFRERSRLNEAIWAELPRQEQAIRDSLACGKTVIAESHLGVHAAYASVLGDRTFLEAFARREGNLLWPDRFLRLSAPIPVSLARQEARGDPRYAVPEEVLAAMLAQLDRWHAERGHALEFVDADRAPAAVIADLATKAGLVYQPQAREGIFPYLLLLGRPAAGKSELIQFLTEILPDERAEQYHVGQLRIADDFPLLWQKFVEDDLWERVGRGRLHSRRAGENYAVSDDHLWPFLVLVLGEELLRHPAQAGETVIVEFARGGPTAYHDALARLPCEVLQRGAILYLDVPFEESWRRNLTRYDRSRRGGILTHSVPREEMERTYARDDWAELAPGGSGYIVAQGIRIPYLTVPNSPQPEGHLGFSRRFAPALTALWRLALGR